MKELQLKEEYSAADPQQELMECVERLIRSCAVPTFVIDGEHLQFLDPAHIESSCYNRSDDLRKGEG